MISDRLDKEHNMNKNPEQTVKPSDFSIDHILNKAGSTVATNDRKPRVCDMISERVKFQWLECSRYCPPRVPRIHKKDIQKRQLGRHPRIPFTSHQLSILEQKFKESPYLSSEEVILLSGKLQLADIRVKIWFQNRRARERREKNIKDRHPKEIIPDQCDNRLFGSVNMNISHEDVDKRQKVKTESETNGSPSECSPVLALNENLNDSFQNACVCNPYILPFLTSNVTDFTTNKDIES